jgi:hypothetical protein
VKTWQEEKKLFVWFWQKNLMFVFENLEFLPGVGWADDGGRRALLW